MYYIWGEGQKVSPVLYRVRKIWNRDSPRDQKVVLSTRIYDVAKLAKPGGIRSARSFELIDDEKNLIKMMFEYEFNWDIK